MVLPYGDVAEEKPSARKARTAPSIDIPSDFESQETFVRHARTEYHDDKDADKSNRDASVEDAKFFAGDQWDGEIASRRKLKRKPVLTINRTVAFVGQIVGTRRQNETAIRCIPDHGGSRDVAEVRSGLIRNIEKTSKASRAYDTALQNQVVGGIGNIGVTLDYARHDVFDQDIKIIEFPDAYSVVWDRLSTDKTGRDANHVFVEEIMPKSAFKERWPWAQVADMAFDGEHDTDPWFSGDDVRVVAYWRMRYEKKTLALLVDGSVVEADKVDDPALIVQNPRTGQPYTREADCPYAEKYIMSGVELLEGPYRLQISRLPVIRVPGWEITIASKRHRFGLVRFLKDPQRLHNYWRSTIAEKLMMTPRARWVASDAAVAGREAQWRNAHLSDDPLLIYNGESGQPPVYTQPAQLEVALVQEANMSVQDLRDVSNLHEAMLGQQSNEVSGKAITARQRVGDLGTAVYHDNLNDAIEELGEVINELIPVAYDTVRTIRTLGPDGKEKFVRINDPEDNSAVDIGVGRYSVSIITGPSTATKRVEAQEAMLAVFNAAPETFAAAADLWVETMDFPGAVKLAKRLRKTLAPGLVDMADLDPEEQQAMQQQQQQQQQQQALMMEVEMAKLRSELENQAADTRKKLADAAKAESDAARAVDEARTAAVQRELIEAQATLARTGALKNAADVAVLAMQDEAATVVAGIEGEITADDTEPFIGDDNEEIE